MVKFGATLGRQETKLLRRRKGYLIIHKYMNQALGCRAMHAAAARRALLVYFVTPQ